MNNLNFERIGEKLRTIRLSKNLTQEYIANAVDINTSHISNIENNRVKVSLSTLVQICNALDTTVDYVLSEEYNDSSSAIEQEILHELHACSNETKEQILKIVKALQ
ncbi:MAG: helix-turn-helix transcriptional regulator [Blautia sp.]|uniref:helix-turn-helix domain-containing protein n=1 Tax=Blautia sp. TaxID=1955243 RepID=UPI002E79F638|nr:helix-turn-helix transcriptional regulator [Blautia sp.]MEE1442766.1 helix-turn-helix transcriptional regulator [Blautia sp.]